MPAEQGRQGWANTQLFADLVGNFGWKLRGAIDQNIDCEKCEAYKNGKICGTPQEHATTKTELLVEKTPPDTLE